MIDANQRWDVGEAISWVRSLAEFRPLWIEEPTSPDDILGHAAISKVIDTCQYVWEQQRECGIDFSHILYKASDIMILTFTSVFQALAPLGIGVATGEQVGKSD